MSLVSWEEALAEVGQRRIGRYHLEEEIGRGMMGVVYRALDPDLQRPIALKVIQLGFPVSAAEHEAFEKRFLAEARAAAGLSHPGIVVVHDVGRDPQTGTPFIAFEYLTGRTLAGRGEEGQPLDWREALRLTARVAEALEHAHAHGIVHRDIKPANVMVLDSGEPKIMDFGIARLAASGLTSTNEFLGTPAYMSPEQLSGASLDGRSDLFSLGAVLYRLLTGRDAFQGGSVAETLARILHQQPVPPSQLVPDLPAGLDDVVARALAKSAEKRYPDAQSFAEALNDIRQKAPPRHAQAGQRVQTQESMDLRAVTNTGQNVSRLRISRRQWLAVGGLAAAGLGALAVMGSWQPGGGPLRVLRPVPPARLEIRLGHTFRGGTLRVWVDDELVMEEPLTSRVTDDLVVVKLRRGRVEKAVDVAPGPHQVRLQVTSADFSASRTIEGTFESGAAQRLSAEAGGLFKKELRVSWVPSPPEAR